jgi:hypothetical protein
MKRSFFLGHNFTGLGKSPLSEVLCVRARLQPCRKWQDIGGVLTPEKAATAEGPLNQPRRIITKLGSLHPVHRSIIAMSGSSQQIKTTQIENTTNPTKTQQCHPERSAFGAPKMIHHLWGKRSEGSAFALKGRWPGCGSSKFSHNEWVPLVRIFGPGIPRNTTS